jgi:uncharacterized protein YggU (UPF0235/DUF167 family)
VVAVSAAARIAVRLTPRGGRDAIEGWEGEVLRARVAAPPEGGKANEALLRLLAGQLGVARSSLTLAGGARSRDKLVEVRGLDGAAVRARLGAGR